MVVVGRVKFPVKTVVQSVDPNAFVIISNAHEVLGEGFRNIKTIKAVSRGFGTRRRCISPSLFVKKPYAMRMVQEASVV